MPVADLITRIVAYADARQAPETPYETGIDGFSLVRCRSATALEPNVYRPLLCVVLRGCKESVTAEEHVRFAAGESLIVSVDLPSQSRVTEASPAEPYVALALEIDLQLIRTLEIDAGGFELAGEQARAIVAGRADDALLDAMARLFDLIDKPLERRVLAPLLLREIHFRALLSAHGAMLRRLSRLDSHASRVHRAIARIRADFPKPVSVADLARAAGMSGSSFHEHFKATTGTTPLQYQKDLRLIEAQQRLLGGGTSVSAVAYDVGYESPTQFSREYARKFGRPPRDDAAQRVRPMPL